jgi:putative flippase GtrA
LIRFGLVGVANTLIDFALFTGLTALGLALYWANLVSTSCGMAFSFFANRRFTFRQRGPTTLRQTVLFVAVTAVGQWGLQPLLILAARAGLEATALSTALVLPAAKVIAIGGSLVYNFVLYKTVVFRGAAPDQPVPEPTP